MTKLFNLASGLVFILFWGIASQAQAADRTRMDSPFVVKEYYAVSNHYGDLSTSILFEDQKQSQDIVWVYADFLGMSPMVEQLGGFEKLRIKEKYLAEHIEAFEKFLKWEEIAYKDGDVFKKKIGKVNKNKYSFQSKDPSNHYLRAQTCLLGCYAPYYFDRENAERVLAFLRKWQAGALKVQSSEEINDKYK